MVIVSYTLACFQALQHSANALGTYMKESFRKVDHPIS